MLKDRIKEAFTDQLVAGNTVQKGGGGFVHDRKVKGITVSACKRIFGVFSTQKLFVRQMEEMGFTLQWSKPVNCYIVMELSEWRNTEKQQ